MTSLGDEAEEDLLHPEGEELPPDKINRRRTSSMSAQASEPDNMSTPPRKLDNRNSQTTTQFTVKSSGRRLESPTIKLQQQYVRRFRGVLGFPDSAFTDAEILDLLRRNEWDAGAAVRQWQREGRSAMATPRSDARRPHTETERETRGEVEGSEEWLVSQQNARVRALRRRVQDEAGMVMFGFEARRVLERDDVDWEVDAGFAVWLSVETARAERGLRG